MMRPVGRAARRPPLSCIGRQARQARSGYSGAASPRGIGNWMPANADFNQLLGMDSGRMRARVRDLVRNFPPFARAVNAMVAFTVGSGARFQSLATLPDGSPDIPTRKRIEDRFRAWMEHADVAGRLHFYEIQPVCWACRSTSRRTCPAGASKVRNRTAISGRASSTTSGPVSPWPIISRPSSAGSASCGRGASLPSTCCTVFRPCVPVSCAA